MRSEDLLRGDVFPQQQTLPCSLIVVCMFQYYNDYWIYRTCYMIIPLFSICLMLAISIFFSKFQALACIVDVRVRLAILANH